MRMSQRQTTALIIGLVIGVLIIYDVYALFVKGGGVEATLSKVIVDTASQNSFVGFLAGFLCGHWFWPQKVKESK